MQATSLALNQLLCAVGDPVADLRAIASGNPEFHQAQAIRAAAGVLAKVPDTFPAIAQAIRATDAQPVAPQTRAHFAAAEAWLETRSSPLKATRQSWAGGPTTCWPCGLRNRVTSSLASTTNFAPSSMP